MLKINSLGKKVKHCIMCKEPDLFLVLDLGMHPHSDFFPTKNQLNYPEILFPLRLCSCSGCGLLQIDYYVNPEFLYQEDYLYQSSTTITGVAHYHNLAEQVVKKFEIEPDSLVVDIGSNVGVLLGGFLKHKMKVLGVDPSENAAKVAIGNGIDTIIDFFNFDNSLKIIKKYGKAKVISATNVFAHLHDLDDAVKGMRELLDTEGIIVVEAPYALDMIKYTEYDTIYHQHIGYISVNPLVQFLKKFNLQIFDVEHIDIHGGTMRYYIGHSGHRLVSNSVKHYVNLEKEENLFSKETLASFAEKVLQQKTKLLKTVLSLKDKGMKIAIISTPAKGNTLLNFCSLDDSLIDYATEKNPLKIGRYTPKTHIPILSDDNLYSDTPDYVILLAWNFAEEIIKNMTKLKEKGVKFIIPIPEPKIF